MTSNLPILSRHVRRLRRRVFSGVFLAEVSRNLLVSLGLCGTAILLLRAFGNPPVALLWAALTPALASFPLAWKRAREATPSPASAVAWFDQRTGSTGALVTSWQLAPADSGFAEEWRTRAEHLADRVDQLPRPRLAGPTYQALGAAAFALVAIHIQLPTPATEPALGGLFAQALERVASKFSALDETVALDGEVRDELSRRLEHLAEEVDSGDLEGLFEGIDRLDEQLQRLANDTLRDGVDALGELTAEMASMEPDRAIDLASQLAKSLGGTSPEALAGELAPALLKLAAGAKLDPASLAQMALGARSELQGVLDALGEAGVLSPGDLAAQLDGLPLAELLQNAGDWDLEALGIGELASAAFGTPGGGGGPGAASPWDGEAGGPLSSGELNQLPTARLLDAEHQSVSSTRVNTPEVAPRGEAAGWVDVAPSGGNQTWRRSIAPKHRAVVRDFFGG